MIWSLTGFMGCGKSAVARELSRRGGFRVYDLDEMIVSSAGRSIPEIFASGGEAAFRTFERIVLEEFLFREAAAPGNTVLSLGGGTLTDAESRKLIQERTSCIYLRASLATLASNLREVGTEGRPLLALEPGQSLEDRIAELMTARAPLYEAAAGHIIDTDGKGDSEIADEIVRLTARTNR